MSGECERCGEHCLDCKCNKDYYLTQFFEMHDGEFFCIQNVDYEGAEPDDQILMDRETAIEMADYIYALFKPELKQR